MSPWLGNTLSKSEPNFTSQTKFVDKAPQGLGKQVAAALDALEMSTTGPSRKTHIDVLKLNTGWAIDPILWAQRSAASKQLAIQTERIASALKRAGVDVVRDGDITLISAVTGIVENLPVYRAIRFLPTVAARDRRPMLNGLKLFMAGHRNSKHFRYAVFTSPEPVPAHGDLRSVIQQLSRRISKWAHKAQKHHMKILFRGIEFTRKTASERQMLDRYESDTPLYHVHANIIYWPTKALRDTEWRAFLKETHAFMKAEWKDNGKVGRIEEIVKYCSKPNDVLSAGDDELVWLYHQTQRLKIAQPMGDFRTWLKELDERGEKVVRVHNGHGDGRLMRVQKLKREKNDDNPSADNEPKTVLREDDASHNQNPETCSNRSPANIILGMSLPQWRHTPWAEPMIMIQHYDPSRISDDDGFDIYDWKRKAREWWDDTWAPPPEEAMRIAKLATDGDLSDDDIREAAEAAQYIVQHM